VFRLNQAVECGDLTNKIVVDATNSHNPPFDNLGRLNLIRVRQQRFMGTYRQSLVDLSCLCLDG
jgi:hypothetical protein